MLIKTKIDYKNKLNSAQYEAATTINGPLLIIAGAGTGKTYMLINRVAYMIEQGIPPESILLLTFTNAAADEMKKRANNILDDRCSRIHASTYHSFCAEMLRKYAKYIGFSNNFTIITPQDVKDAIKYVKAKNPIYKARQFPNCAKIAKIFSGAINNNISITQYVDKEHIECRNFTNELEQLYLEFQTYKKSRDMMDYDDILIYFYELLQNSIIQNRISNSYKYVMVDEYQDTNDLQEKIIIKLCQNNNNIAVVGDDYQSIYGFRGSNVNNFIGFPDKFSNCKRVTLSQNYRSSQEILDFANKIMDKHANFGYKKNMIAHRGYLNEPIQIWNGEDTSEECQFIIKNIIEHKKNGGKYKDIAILERKARHSLEIETKLTELNIPYDKKGGLKLMDHAAIIDLLAFFRVIVNFKDELAWFRLLQLIPGIGDTYARNISSLSLIDTDFLINNPYQKRPFYQGLFEFNEFMSSIFNTQNEDDNFSVLYDKIVKFYYKIRKNNIMKMKVDEEGNRKIYLHDLDNDKSLLEDFKKIAIKYENISKLLDALLTNNLNDKVGKSDDEDEDNVIISTVHSAKGLEYKIVYVLNCVDKVFPSTTRYEEGNAEDNEELRCFYVAITRAKDKLYIMSPSYVCENGEFCGTPSHFLKDPAKIPYKIGF